MKILVLAGGSDQIALIKELQNRGHEVILLDYLDNPPAKIFVKTHIQESTLDYDKVKEVAIRERVDMVCTACTDQALLTAAKVSEELHLPFYISYNTALLVTNKSYMKQRMVDGGIPTSKYMVLKENYDVDRIMDFSFPLIIKPADCNSSKGVVKVNGINEFNTAIANAFNLSRSSTAIVEEFVEGEEISADFYIDGDNPILLSATSSSKIKGTNGFTITASNYPAVSGEQELELMDIAKRISDRFTLKNCPLLVQLINSKGRFSVIEFSARMGGGSKYRLIQEISGVNIMSDYVDLLLGNKPNVRPSKSNKAIKILYIYTLPGIITAIKGVDKLKEEGWIKDWFQYKTLPTKIDGAHNSGDRPLGLLIEANDKDEMAKCILKISQYLAIENEEGINILRHDLINTHE